jgi:hypothetical protein
VLLVDADPAASALEWSNLAADDGGFPFRVISLPSKTLHQRIPDIACPDEVVVTGSPQIGDHAAIAGSVMRIADELVVTGAPTPIGVNRTAPFREEIEKCDAARVIPARVSGLLNWAIANANSLRNTRDVLAELGYHVLGSTIYRTEAYAQAFGSRPRAGERRPVARGCARAA